MEMTEKTKGLRKRVFTQLGAKELRPEGWLKKQLLLQAEGLSGHLDLIWPDIRDSKWIGGDREGWERVPYWLDGFIPLAWLLEDEALKARAKRYVDAILDRQQEDGWICPCSGEERDQYDVWAAFLICKVLVVYEQCSREERVEEAVYRALRQLLSHISSHTLFGWGAARWFECLIPLFWLYERRPEPWMLELAHVLDGCGIDYEKLYHSLSFERPGQKHYWTFLNHVVNVAMALKSRAEMSRLTGEDADGFAQFFYEKLIREHGMPIGHFTGDECLSGTSPVQGSECCSVVEAMYSYEELLSIGGNPRWGDLLEQTAFNALAATVSADMWSHQYVQMTNQIQCTRLSEEANPFNSNNGDAHRFGLEPHFGCCTANFNQGWPKLALSAVMKSAEGLAVCALVPMSVRTQVGEACAELSVDTQYPFRDSLRIGISVEKRTEFELAVRIPGFAKAARVRINGGEEEQAHPGTFWRLKKEWEGTEQIELFLEFEPSFVRSPDGLETVRRGPLFFALPIGAEYERVEYVKDGVERRYPYCDYNISPNSDWAFGFAGRSLALETGPLPGMPFDRDCPPVTLEASLVPLDWEDRGGICAAAPRSLEPVGKAVKRKLYPYGCTTLRMGALPVVEGEKK
ncbi:MAG: glycoside hydrolase family 127 protein [Eubacteriales bacterium]|nr:glycoside hydrolase family 127 protein [Eubacteriales bacterium]